MTQRILPFQYEVEDRPSGMTAMGGLPLYLDMMQQMGFSTITITPRRVVNFSLSNVLMSRLIESTE